GELEERRLENRDVVPRLGVEALEQRRLRFIEMRQLLLGQAVAPDRVLDQLLIHVAVAEPLRQAHADLGPACSHLVGYCFVCTCSTTSELVIELLMRHL